MEKSNIASVITVVVVLMLAGLAYSYWQGSKHGEAAIDRLDLVWKYVKKLPESDRAFLARITQECDLINIPMEKEFVIKHLTRCVSFNADDAKQFDRLLNNPDIRNLTVN